jgi:hypothetical protein
MRLPVEMLDSLPLKRRWSMVSGSKAGKEESSRLKQALDGQISTQTRATGTDGIVMSPSSSDSSVGDELSHVSEGSDDDGVDARVATMDLDAHDPTPMLLEPLSPSASLHRPQ